MGLECKLKYAQAPAVSRASCRVSLYEQHEYVVISHRLERESLNHFRHAFFVQGNMHKMQVLSLNKTHRFLIMNKLSKQLCQ